MAFVTRTYAGRVNPAFQSLRRLVDIGGHALALHDILISELSLKGKLHLEFFLREDKEFHFAEWNEGGELQFFNFAPNGIQERLVKAYCEAYAALMVRE